MSLTRHRRTRRLKNEMNVVPYIDVMLVLLIIFMITAPMITPGVVNLPSVGASSTVPSTPVEIQLSEDGNVSIRLRSANSEFQDIAKDDIVNQVKQLTKPDTPIVLAADGKVPYEEVMKIMDTLRSNGMTHLALMVNQKADKPSK